MTKARDLSKLLSTSNGKIAGSNLDVSFENISDTGTTGTKVASGTTAQRGSTTGQWRYNSNTNFFEGKNNSSFVALAPTPTVTSVSPTEVASASGGNVDIVIQGSNFDTGTSVKFIGNDASEFSASSVALNSSIQITATVAKNSFINSKEPYDVKITANSGLQATLENVINVDNLPTWSTASGSLGGDFEGESYSFTVSATDADGETVAYSIQSGSLPSGGSLNTSSGVISGTHPTVSSNTTSTFTIRATAGGKTSDRQFSILTINATTNIYTSSGNFTLASAQAVKIYTIGGGGGGGSVYRGSAGGSGGGGGGMAYKLFSNVPAGTYSYTVGGSGAGGDGSNSETGQNGGTTSITIGSVTLQATGGSGGARLTGTDSNTGSVGLGGAGGVGSNGDTNGTGGAGANGIYYSNPGSGPYNGIDASNGTNGGAGGGGGGTDLGSGNSYSMKAGNGGTGSSTYYTGGGGGGGWDNDGQTPNNSQRGLGGSGYTSGGNGGSTAIASTDGGGNAGGARGSSGSSRNNYGGGGASYGGGGGGSGSADGGTAQAGSGGGGAIVIIS